jgi:replicative DNA helicase
MTDPLYSPNAEESFIGSILIDPEQMRETDLIPEEIYVERNRWIYIAAQDLRLSGQSVDYVTVCARLDAMGKLALCGGPARLTELVNVCPDSGNIKSYADIIRDRARRRDILDTANRLANLAHDLDSDMTNGIPEQIDRLSRAATQSAGAVRINQFLGDLYDQVAFANANPSDIYGIATGLDDWDRIAGGLIKREIVKLAGDPGIGKSLLAFQIACGCAAHAPGVVYELEMSGISVVRRRISTLSKVSSNRMRTGRLKEGEETAINQAIEAMERLPIWMCDQSNMTSLAMRVDLERLKAQHGIEWFLLDYEGLLTDDPDKDDITRSKVISSRVHAIAKDLDLAGLVIDDMNKAGIDNASSGKANLSGSARKLYDADAIVMLRQDPQNKQLVAVTWEKLRDGEGSRSMILQRVEGFPAFQQPVIK